MVADSKHRSHHRATRKVMTTSIPTHKMLNENALNLPGVEHMLMVTNQPACELSISDPGQG